MRLFKRIADIISANLGELADDFDDTESMLNQAIREMDESIREATQDTAKALANEKRLAKELSRNEKEAKAWQSRAEQAVEAGEDDEARSALSRKLEHEKLAAALNDQLAAAKDASQTLRHQLDAMKAKLSEAKRNLAGLSARKKAADVRKRAYSGPDESDVGFGSDAFDKFDRMREKVEQSEAEADALAELQGVDAVSTSETEQPEAEQDIEDELEALKKKRSR